MTLSKFIALTPEWRRLWRANKKCSGSFFNFALAQI